MKMLQQALMATLVVAANVTYAEVVVIVNPSVVENSINATEAANIFLGKQTTLPEGTRVQPLDQREGSERRNEFYLKVVNKNAMQLKSYWSLMIFTGKGTPPPSVADSMEVRSLVASTPNAIGYIDATEVDTSVKVLLTVP